MGKRLNDTTKILNTPYSSILGLRDTMTDKEQYDKMIQEDFIQEVKHEIEENGYDFLNAVPLAHETCGLYDYNLREEATAEYREKEIKTLNEKKD